MSFRSKTRAKAARSGLSALVLGAGVLLLARAAHAESPCTNVAPWDRLGRAGAHFARPEPLALTGLAIATPFAFAPTGLDQRLRVVSQRDLGGKPNLEPVSVATPYVLAGSLVIADGVSAIIGSCEAQRVLAPVLQAGSLTFVSMSLLKLGVGRSFPNGGADPNAPDRLDHPERAHDFAPFQRGFAGWPSGHTAIMMSAAAAFRTSNPELGAASFVGYPFALAVGAGMWLGDHHYASDILSGALFGEAIGDSVGRSFAREVGAPGAFTLLPRGDGGFELVWAGLW